MTIARKLDEIKIEKASKLFENHKTDFKFLCYGFTRLDPQKSQI